MSEKRPSERLMELALSVRELEDTFAHDPGAARDLADLIGRRVAESAELRYSSQVATLRELMRTMANQGE